jgi:hypothetical protein
MCAKRVLTYTLVHWLNELCVFVYHCTWNYMFTQIYGAGKKKFQIDLARTRYFDLTVEMSDQRRK